MLNTIRQYQAKTRKAFLAHNRVEETLQFIKHNLKVENDELASLRKDVNKSIKKKPNGMQTECLRLLDEIERMRKGPLAQYIQAEETKKTTKKKK